MKFNSAYYLGGEIGDARRMFRNAVRNAQQKRNRPHTRKGCAGHTWGEFHDWFMEFRESLRGIKEHTDVWYALVEESTAAVIFCGDKAAGRIPVVKRFAAV